MSVTAEYLRTVRTLSLTEKELEFIASMLEIAADALRLDATSSTIIAPSGRVRLLGMADAALALSAVVRGIDG